MVFDGLTSTFDRAHMVQQNSIVARELGISREDQDALGAALARARGEAAQDAGPLRRRDRAVGDVDRRRVARGATPRREAGARSSRSSTRRARRPPATRPGVNDGASCVVVCSRSSPRSAGSSCSRRFSPRGTSRTTSPTSRARPRRPARSRSSSAGRRSTTWSASRSTRRSRRSRQLDEAARRRRENVNVNGGAVALGHPIGACGGRIVGTMVHELRRNGGGLGLAAICSGGGQGDALLLEV